MIPVTVTKIFGILAVDHYNSARATVISEILVPDWRRGLLSWPIQQCPLIFPQIDPCCHSNKNLGIFKQNWP